MTLCVLDYLFQFNNTKFTSTPSSSMVSFFPSVSFQEITEVFVYWIVDVDVLVPEIAAPEGVEEAERGAIVAAVGEM